MIWKEKSDEMAKVERRPPKYQAPGTSRRRRRWIPGTNIQLSASHSLSNSRQFRYTKRCPHPPPRSQRTCQKTRRRGQLTTRRKRRRARQRPTAAISTSTRNITTCMATRDTITTTIKTTTETTTTCTAPSLIRFH